MRTGLRGARERRFENMRIGSAATDVSGDRMLDVVQGRRGIRYERGGYRHHHSRRAEAALQRIVFDERSLHWMHPFGPAETFDRDDLMAARIDREHHACVDR